MQSNIHAGTVLFRRVSKPDGQDAFDYSSEETPFTFDSLVPLEHRGTCGRRYLLVSIPLIAAVRDETEQERSGADVSFSCSSGGVHHRRRRRRTEHRASARSDLDGDQGRGDYCLPASSDTPANWAQGHGLPPLGAGNVRSAKDLQHPAFVLARPSGLTVYLHIYCSHFMRMQQSCCCCCIRQHVNLEA